MKSKKGKAKTKANRLGLRHEKKIIKGVGAGIAEWIGVNEWIVRFLAIIYFLLVFNWYGIILAVIAWIATYAFLWGVLRGIKHEGSGANTRKKRKR